MPAPGIHSILAATDLGKGSDAIVRSAAVLAARAGAELHLLHSLELPWVPAEDVMRRTGFFEQIASAKERLRDQADRTMPEGIRPASQKVIIYIAHRALLDRAQEVSADLIVVGPHRGGAVGAHFLGTTVDRVIRTAEVPCLVVEEPLTEPLRSIGVPVDFSDPSQGALEAAFGWALQLGGGAADAPDVRVMYVGGHMDQASDPHLEERTIRPELERQVERARSCVDGAGSLRVAIEVRWANNPTEAIVDWAEAGGVDLLVMGTHGTSGLKRALIGSTASSVARQTPRPVVLVPPSIWCGRAHVPRLERVGVVTDFSDSSREAARWSLRALAPDAEHRLVHVLEVPEPPAMLSGRFGSREELLRSAREGARARLEELRGELSRDQDRADAIRTEVLEGDPAEQIVRLADDVDLVVMGEHGRSEVKRGAWTMLGTTVERVLRGSPAPVLVARGAPEEPPRDLLVAVDGSDASLRALSWADFLRRRYGGSLEVLYVKSPAVSGYADLTYTGSVAALAAGYDPDQEAREVREREGWLREEVRRSGIDPSAVAVRVATGSPAAEILAEQERAGTALIVMGTRGRGALGRALLGSVASAVLHTASCSVLVVGDPPRSAAVRGSG